MHDEAERLEHAVSDALIERMARALGNPRFDPHGDPIPSPDGSIDELAYTPLTDVPLGEAVEIRRVDTSESDRLRFLEQHGLKPGVRLTVVGRQPFQGPLMLRLGAQDQVLGHELAQQVLCVPVEAR